MKYLVVGLTILVVFFFLGPKVTLDDSINPIQLPSDIENYINNSEAQLEGVRPGTEKTIIWADPSNKTKTPVSVVYIHGFSASRQEIAPLCDRVADALQANLYYTRLPGHGRDEKAMAKASVNAMLNDANEALLIGQRLGQQVIIIASSTGATLATLTALRATFRETFREDTESQQSILALVLLSPNFGVQRRESELLLMPWAEQIVELVEGPLYQYKPQNELQTRYWTTEYPSIALIQMMGLVKLIRDKPLENINQPVLVLYSPDDKILSIDAMKDTFNRFGSSNKQLVAIDNSGDNQRHILAGDALSPATTDAVFKKVMAFIKPL